MIASKWFPALAVASVLLVRPHGVQAQPAPEKVVDFEAPSVGRTMKYSIALPEGYEGSEKRYPVVYLLHGLTGNYHNWARMGAGKAAKPFDLIVVMPDAGNSWYVNWAEAEGDRPNKWDDYITKDLIAHIDATYRTIARREGRAINGLSMGGYGAMTLGLRHPDLYCSIGSASGALGFARQAGERIKSGQASPPRRNEPSNDPIPGVEIPGFSSPAERSPKGKAFATLEQAQEYDPFQLITKVPKEKLPHIYVDCGTEDRLVNASQEFAKVMMEKHIPFTFAESPGEHNPAYWSREIHPALAVQAMILKRNLATIKDETPAK